MRTDHSQNTFSTHTAVMASWGLVALALLAKTTFATLHHGKVSNSMLHERSHAGSGNLQALHGVMCIAVICHLMLVLPEYGQQQLIRLTFRLTSTTILSSSTGGSQSAGTLQAKICQGILLVPI